MIAHSTDVGSRIQSRPSKRASVSPRRSFQERQEVAAVCYRHGESGLEFLLVRTRSGRWTFPKGGVEPHLSHAQSAALEAFEEAGVHGRIEEVPFARYYRQRPKRAPGVKSNVDHPHRAVTAHLCEVSRLERPQESNRKPTWFSPEKAKQRLLADRAEEFGDELASVVDRAVARIGRLKSGRFDTRTKDALHRVHLDSPGHAPLLNGRKEIALVRALLLEGRSPRRQNAVEMASRAILPKVLQLGAGARISGETTASVAPSNKPGRG